MTDLMVPPVYRSTLARQLVDALDTGRKTTVWLASGQCFAGFVVQVDQSSHGNETTTLRTVQGHNKPANKVVIDMAQIAVVSSEYQED